MTYFDFMQECKKRNLRISNELFCSENFYTAFMSKNDKKVIELLDKAENEN